ncbi:cupredoxin family protein [Hahella sp. SMD15-11]|uniref:Cupredoxin family protein n=1 Tax=Thermohahella caldifontis TaxID=3142973 RepID=A0AB39USL3_9GAMM
MLKRSLNVLMLTTLPVLALAGGNHGNSHDMSGHNMQDMDSATHSGASLSDIGRPGDPARVDRTIEVIMDDSMRFTPSDIVVRKGETVRFFIRNTGKVPHELVIGTMDELRAHAESMRNAPRMQHAEPNMVRLKPGQRGGLVWQFDEPGTVDFACLIPGHMEAGMQGKIRITAG